jgi:ABC-type uncharacterized transport system fused permease/ATPase subunit
MLRPLKGLRTVFNSLKTVLTENANNPGFVKKPVLDDKARARLMNQTALETNPGFLKNLWNVVEPFWVTQSSLAGKAISYGLLAANFACNWAQVKVVEIGLNNWVKEWGKVNKGAAILQDKHLPFMSPEVQTQYHHFNDMWGWYFGLGVESVALSVAAFVLAQGLALRWQLFEVNRSLDKYLSNDNFRKISKHTSNGGEGIDQRIQEDSRNIPFTLSALATDGLANVNRLWTFIPMLYGISPDFNTASLHLPGPDITISHGLVALPILYAGLTSWVTLKVGGPVAVWQYALQKTMAGFRRGLLELVGDAEGIALLEGAEAELKNLKKKVSKVSEATTRLIASQASVLGINAFIGQMAEPAPWLIMGRGVYENKIGFDDLRGFANSFTQVTNAAGWFGANAQSIMELWASTARYGAAHNAMDRANDDMLRKLMAQEKALPEKSPLPPMDVEALASIYRPA